MTKLNALKSLISRISIQENIQVHTLFIYFIYTTSLLPSILSNSHHLHHQNHDDNPHYPHHPHHPYYQIYIIYIINFIQSTLSTWSTYRYGSTGWNFHLFVVPKRYFCGDNLCHTGWDTTGWSCSRIRNESQSYEGVLFGNSRCTKCSWDWCSFKFF